MAAPIEIKSDAKAEATLGLFSGFWESLVN